MKQQQLILVGIIVLAIVGGGFVLMSKNTSAPQPTPQSTESTQVSPTTAPSASGSSAPADAMTAAKTITVEGGPFWFKPNEIKVKKGDTVKIVFKNTEGFHDWAIDEFKATTKKIQAGQEDTVTFLADKVGTFEYYCSVGNHRAQGMKGNLIVE